MAATELSSYLGNVGECSLESLWHRDAVDKELELNFILTGGRKSKGHTYWLRTTHRQLATIYTSLR